MSAIRQGGLTQINTVQFDPRDGVMRRSARATAFSSEWALVRVKKTCPTGIERSMRLTSACVTISILMMTAASAATPAERRGLGFAKSHCARCHAIGRTGSSRLEKAPPFRTLHQRYPIETLAEAFAEGIYTGHSKMPAFELEPDQINDLLSYLKSLERSASPR
jgi:mono/diheme cytochrome c family protein